MGVLLLGNCDLELTVALKAKRLCKSDDRCFTDPTAFGKLRDAQGEDLPRILDQKIRDPFVGTAQTLVIDLSVQNRFFHAFTFFSDF